MKFNRGLANIPLILGLLLLVIAVPVGVKLVQDNQNLQNRAYEAGPIGSVDCTQIFNAKIKYCSNATGPIQPGVPCSEIDYAIAKHCTQYPPKQPQITPIITSIPKPSPTP